jgi:hypothetical protein
VTGDAPPGGERSVDASVGASGSDRDADERRRRSSWRAGLSLEGTPSAIPKTREGQRALSDYARAVAEELLRESARPRAADADGLAAFGSSHSGGFLLEAFEEEPDTAMSRVLVPLNHQKLLSEFRSLLPEGNEGDDDEPGERRDDDGEKRERDK